MIHITCINNATFGFAARNNLNISSVRANGQSSNRWAICHAVGLEAQNAASNSGVWAKSPHLRITHDISSAVGFAARKAASILGVRANGQPSNRKAICRAVGLEAQNAASNSGVWAKLEFDMVVKLSCFVLLTMQRYGVIC